MKRKVSATTRLLHDLFTQYPSTFIAFCELLNNAIQAHAKNIDIKIDYPSSSEISLNLIRRIEVKDDGIGVYLDDIQDKLLDFGDSAKKGGKGIGRFAALQIGSNVVIETVGYDQNSKRYSRSIIPFNEQYIKSVKKIEDLEIDTDEKVLNGNHNTYYKVIIDHIYDPSIVGRNQKRKISERLLEPNLANAIFERYPIVIFNKTVRFKINGKILKPDDFIEGEPIRHTLSYVDKKGKEHALYFTFIQLKSTIEEIKVFLTTKNAGVDTIVWGFEFEADWLDPTSKGWFVYIHSDNLDTDLYRNLELEGMDNRGHDFRMFIKDRLNDFFKAKNKKFDDFLAKLRKDNYYPYKNPENATSKSKVVLFDKVAYLVEERYNLFTVNKPLREIIYPLIDRTIVTGELDEVLKKILRLENKTVKQFKSLLDRAEIEDIIDFSERVSKKLEDLNLLEKLTCTEISKHIAERKELHKVLEKMVWVFGEQYLDNTTLLSDTNLENNLKKLRGKIFTYKPDKKEDNISEEVKGTAKSITDLFLYSEKPIDGVKREILVVELKAPKVKISSIEIQQAMKYARQIEESPFYTEDMNVHIILISTDINKDTQFNIKGIQKPRGNPFFYFQNENKNIVVSVMRWAQVIEINKRKLNYLSGRLKIKDIDVEEKINNDFSEISFDKVRSTLRKVAIPQ
ncbi:ATP-binding protein [Pedobacter gandavensis]|uniref:ATP-binding protein n=1 Tax=Pedobacter gandavensis TaxID=2679963 RepID=UPI00247A48ED|nr:ATP-binding protein [Pedobacter gandavensis]WGQ09740.1 ATP-binding protein [Pedobacter gandavensis]